MIKQTAAPVVLLVAAAAIPPIRKAKVIVTAIQIAQQVTVLSPMPPPRSLSVFSC